LCSISKLKTRPWFTRRGKRIPGRGIPRMNAKLPTEFSSEETPTPSVQLLLSLGFAFSYLPALLHSASYSSELVELAKCWWSRKYLHLIFPDGTVRAEKAIKEYLLRVSGENGYILFLDFIFRSQRWLILRGEEDSGAGQNVTVSANVWGPSFKPHRTAVGFPKPLHTVGLKTCWQENFSDIHFRILFRYSKEFSHTVY